jgi:FkbM family methyltransferase
MDLKALSKNWQKARTRCPSLKDRLKYLAWLYNRPKLAFQGRALKIRFALGAPIGNLTLNVRCNRGSDAFIFSEVFEHRYYDFALPDMPRTILDLGANIGFTGLYFARKFPDADIVCVEPMPENVKLLKENLDANQAAARVVAKAVAVEDGTVTMQKSEMDYGHKVNAIKFGKQFTGETIEVGAVSVPTLMGELGWKRIGLLKIDVEGYEGVLLRQNCAWLNNVDAICIECHEGFSKMELCEIAAKYDFLSPKDLPGTLLLIRP